MVFQIDELAHGIENFRFKRSISQVRFLSQTESKKNEKINEEHVLVQGYLRKVKCLKKRYVILEESFGTTLQIFDNKRRYHDGASPKKVIHIYDIFNVTRINEKKNPFTFRIFVANEKIDLIADTEEELMLWIHAIERARENLCNKKVETLRRASLKVNQWIINVKPRGLALIHDLSGEYIVQITSSHFNFLGINHPDQVLLAIPLWLIRKSVYTENVLFVELIEHETFESTEIWLDTESNDLAEEIHRFIEGSYKPRTRTYLQDIPTNDTIVDVLQQKPVEFKRSQSYSDLLMESSCSHYGNVLFDKNHYGNVLFDTSNHYGNVSIDSGFGSTSPSTTDVSRSSSIEIQGGLLRHPSQEDIFKFEPIIDEIEDNDVINDVCYENHAPTNTLYLQKSSTSSSLADDESEDCLYSNQGALTLSGVSLTLNEQLRSPQTTKYQRRKQRRSQYESYENITTTPTIQSAPLLNEFNMDPVNLVRFKTDTSNICEPFYESVGTSRNSPINNVRTARTLRKQEDNNTPEGSPSLTNRKYIVNTKPIVPKQPPLPKRNPNNSLFYLKQDEYETMECPLVKDASNANHVTETPNEIESEHKYIDLDTVERIRKSLILDDSTDHSYAEIKVKSKQTARSRSVDQSDLNRELVTLKFPSRKTSSEKTLDEEDDNTTNSIYSDTTLSGKTPTRSRSTPVKLNQSDAICIEFNDNIDAGVIVKVEKQRHSYMNNSPIPQRNSRLPQGYEDMSGYDQTENQEVSYDNYDPASNSLELAYADINIQRYIHNPTEKVPSKFQQLDEGVKYTSIDFQKSKGINAAVRERDIRLNDGGNDYMTDLSHKTFKKT